MQSGDAFRIQSNYLARHLGSSLAPVLTEQFSGRVEFFYPTGPACLDPTDIPGQRSESASISDEPDELSEPMGWAWWSYDTRTSHFRGLGKALDCLSDYIKVHGPFDGVIGFSQGGALAVVLASLCEAEVQSERRKALLEQRMPVTQQAPQIPLRFVVCFSGYPASDSYKGIYDPKIKTPALLVSGQLDTIVATDTTKSLLHAFDKAAFLTHHSGHCLPRESDLLGKSKSSYIMLVLRVEYRGEGSLG